MGPTGTSRVVSPALTTTGLRPGGGASSARSVANRSIPTPVAADPQTTGKTTPSATPVARVCSSSSLDGISPSR